MYTHLTQCVDKYVRISHTALIPLAIFFVLFFDLLCHIYFFCCEFVLDVFIQFNSTKWNSFSFFHHSIYIHLRDDDAQKYIIVEWKIIKITWIHISSYPWIFWLCIGAGAVVDDRECVRRWWRWGSFSFLRWSNQSIRIQSNKIVAISCSIIKSKILSLLAGVDCHRFHILWRGMRMKFEAVAHFY